MICILGFICFWLKLTLANRLIYQDPNQVTLTAETFANVSEEFVNLPLDHMNAAGSTFRNRFFVKTDWYEKGGPVFLYDGGEGAADPRNITSDTKTPYEDLSFFERFLKDHGGLGIVWEHRYYGESLPLPERRLKQSREEDFKYLTTQQALSDVVAFAQKFSRSDKSFDGLDLTPKKTPWIFVGCSYPGSRAALMRVEHSDTIFASYAASAPIQARVDMSSYWEPIWSGMRKYGYSNCTADMHAAIIAIDARLSKSAADAFNIKRQIFGCTDPPLSDGNFADYLSNLWTTWQSFDMKPGDDPPRPGIKEMCDFISYNPGTGSYSDAGGWAKVHRNGVDFTLDRLKSWPGFTNQTSFGETNISCPSTPPSASIRCQKDKEVDNISWKYQYCTEWGYLQVGNPGSSQIVSKYSDLNFYRQQCLCQFKSAGKGPRAIPDTPRADMINQKYGGWNMRPSRTFFTVGEFDPWRTLSPLKVDNTTIPDCEASTAPGSPLFGKILRNKQHCGDFDSKDPDARAAHKLFSAALKKWLCCYAEKNKGNLNKGAKDVLCPKS